MSILRFINSVRKHWWTLMSCAVFTLLGTWVLYANESNAWALRTTFGLAVFCLFWACFLAWGVKENEVKQLEAKLQAATTSAPPVQNIYPPARPVPPKPEVLKHDVQCLGVESGEMAARIGFINVGTPNQKIGSFHRARLKIRYSLAHSGEEVALVFPARWIGSDEDEISIGFVPQYAVLAVYIGNQWHGVKTVEVLTPQSEAESHFRRELMPLPSAELRIEATLIGVNNLSLVPFTGTLTLRESGAAFFSPDA